MKKNKVYIDEDILYFCELFIHDNWYLTLSGYSITTAEYIIYYYLNPAKKNQLKLYNN